MDTSRRKFFQQQCAPVVKEYQLMREFVLFQQQNLTNIYVVPSHASANKWFGVIFIHEGPYQGAILRFTLTIPIEYPCHEAPKLFFDSIPFHPLVNPKTGELSSARAFPIWNPNTNHVWQIVLLAKMIFIDLEKHVDAEYEYTSLTQSNDLAENFHSQAVKMYKEDFETFQLKIAETIAECHSRIYDPPNDANDQNAIMFGPWNPQQHEEIRQKLLAGQTPPLSDTGRDSGPSSIQGLSWVQKGSMQMFSK